jgi:hypothetical protein
MRRFVVVVLLTGCLFKGKDEETGDATLAELCGDIDGSGGDTGDVPNVLGLWTADFGQGWFDSNCDGYNSTDFSWLTGALEIDGYVPDGVQLILDGDDAKATWGAVTPQGGMVFAGQIVDGSDTWQIGASGLVYRDPWLERDVWKGSIYLGLDSDGDNGIDCDVQGSWFARKSGS